MGRPDVALAMLHVACRKPLPSNPQRQKTEILQCGLIIDHIPNKCGTKYHSDNHKAFSMAVDVPAGKASFWSSIIPPC